jgi:hypothetical protein
LLPLVVWHICWIKTENSGTALRMIGFTFFQSILCPFTTVSVNIFSFNCSYSCYEVWCRPIIFFRNRALARVSLSGSWKFYTLRLGPQWDSGAHHGVEHDTSPHRWWIRKVVLINNFATAAGVRRLLKVLGPAAATGPESQFWPRHRVPPWSGVGVRSRSGFCGRTCIDFAPSRCTTRQVVLGTQSCAGAPLAARLCSRATNPVAWSRIVVPWWVTVEAWVEGTRPPA